MPDNRDGALPGDGGEGAAAAAAVADPPVAGQSEPAASAAATDVPPVKQEKPAAAAPEKKAVWEEAGFKSAEEMAKSYKELRGKYNERDKEINALRDGRKELDSLKGLVFPEGDGGKKQTATPAKTAKRPPAASGSEAGAQDPVENIRTFMGPETADFVKGLQDDVARLRGDFDSGRRASEAAQSADAELRAEESISQLIEDVGVEEYARVMRNPRYEQFAARQVIVDGLPADYVYAGLAATLNAERAKTDRSSSGQADTNAGGGGGALPPGGKTGGTQGAAPKSELEEAFAGMQEAAKDSSEDFFAKGRDK